MIFESTMAWRLYRSYGLYKRKPLWVAAPWLVGRRLTLGDSDTFIIDKSTDIDIHIHFQRIGMINTLRRALQPGPS